MATTAVPRSVEQAVRHELAALGFSASHIKQAVSDAGIPSVLPGSGLNGSATYSRKGLFNTRIRRLAQIAHSDASCDNKAALPEVARRAICKFLCDNVEYQSIYHNAKTRLTPIDVEGELRSAAARERNKAAVSQWLSRANIVAFLKSQLGEKFATAFYLCLPPEESWRVFWRKIVADKPGNGHVVYRDSDHLCGEFASYYVNRLFLEWPTKAMDLLKLGLTSLLCQKIDSREIMSVYTDIFVRLFGLDGQPCVREPGQMKFVANNLETTKQMIFTLEQALGSPGAIDVFTVVAQHFSDEFEEQWTVLLPVSASMEIGESVVTLDSPLRALFTTATYTPYVNCLEERGVTNLRQLCGSKIETLRSIPGLRRQATDRQSVMAKKLATVGLRLGMSSRGLAEWEQHSLPP